MTHSINILAEHAARTLPDSITERKIILRSIEAVLKDKHPAKAMVRAQLVSIETVESLQSQLPLGFVEVRK